MTDLPPSDLSCLSALKAHDSFFARIIDMIPAELYRHSLSEDADNDNTKYYKVCMCLIRDYLAIL